MSARLVVLDADGEAELERLLDEEEWSLGRAGRAAIDEALIELRRLRASRALLLDDVARAEEHRRAVDTGGQRVGHGGPLGGCPPSALAHLREMMGADTPNLTKA